MQEQYTLGGFYYNCGDHHCTEYYSSIDISHVGRDTSLPGLIGNDQLDCHLQDGEHGILMYDDSEDNYVYGTCREVLPLFICMNFAFFHNCIDGFAWLNSVVHLI